MHRHVAAFAVLLAASACGAGLASAQSLIGAVDASTAQPLAQRSASGAVLASRPVTVPADASAMSERLISFEQARSALRLEGEDDVMRLTFVADQVAVGSGGELQLAYRNAVSVMPEASLMAVSVNGAKIGDFPIRSPSGFEVRSIAIPASVLRIGVNEVELHAVQRHRVDCSMEATYELWTEISQVRSGFKPVTMPSLASFAGLRMVGHTEDGLTDIRLVVPEGAGTATLTAALPVIETVALLIDRQDVNVTVASTPGTGPGIDVIVGIDSDPRTLDNIPQGAAGGLSVVASADPRRAVVVARVGNESQIAPMLASAVETTLKPLLDAGVRGSHPGEIRGDAARSYTLADTGYTPRPFAGRLFRTDFDIVLPADFYPAEYATLDLALHAATSPGLKPTSQLLVRVNDQIVKSLPMRDTGGEVFSGRRMELPLRAFHPGRNKVELLAELENDNDDSCVFSARDEVSPRFILLGGTEIRVPSLARVARMPELASTVGMAWPYDRADGVTVYAVRPDARSVSSALTMVTRLSHSAGTPLNARIAFGLPEHDPSADRNGNAIVVASKRALEESQRLGAAPLADAIQFADSALDYDSVVTAAIGIDPNAMLVAKPDPAALLEAFRQTTRKDDESVSLGNFREGLADTFAQFRRWLNYERPVDISDAAGKARTATLAQRPSVGGDGVVTWLTADTPADLTEATALLSDPQIWSRVEGEVARLNLDDRTIRTDLPAAYFGYELNDYGPANLRRIAAAWFSDNFRIYVIVVIALLGVFALWLGRMVPSAGVRTDK